MKIIDDFLPHQEFQLLQLEMMGEAFPWYYSRYTLQAGDKIDYYQFTHCFFNQTKTPVSAFQSLVIPIVEKLKIRTLYRIKANLNHRTVFHRDTGWHVDWPNITTAVYYVNTNNGWTRFKKGGRVKSVANRIVIFDSDLEHKGVTCTDEKTRVVINLNYVPAL